MIGREGVTAAAPPSGTVTFLFSDIEGSTSRWDRDRDAMQEALRLHDHLMRAAMAAHAGHVFKTIGDAFCAAFSTPESAAAAAISAQLALGQSDFSAVDGLRVRMAINTGTADERDGDYFGPVLNRVARLLTLGHGGQVLLSGIAADLVRENPPPQATMVALGEHVLKDLERHEQVYQLVAPGLPHDFRALRGQKVKGPWVVPDAMRTPYFTGRENLLARLRQQLVERHRAVLSGLGGIGKTQTAIEYAMRHRPDYRDGVFWINAETVSGLTTGFVEIAKTVGLTAADSNDQEQVVQAALEWLSVNDHWLLILDNADDRRAVRRFVPQSGTGDVLITSRESVFAELGIPRALEVGDMNDAEAVRLLLSRTGRDDVAPAERDAASELTADLGNLPLALEQAAAYIAETGASFSDYLGAFRKRRAALLERARELVSHDTVAATWAANFEGVESASPAAAEVLHISAFLAPDAIAFEIFTEGAQALGEPIAQALSDPDDLAMTELLRPLTRYSLIRSDATSRTYAVHRLVQQILRAAISQAQGRKYVTRAVAALEASFPEPEYAKYPLCNRLVPHVVALAEWAGCYDAQPEMAGRVFSRATRYLWERARYAEAQALSERALAIAERAFGPNHPDVSRCLNDLAVVHWYQGRFSEAQARNERALAIRESALGPGHLDVASSLNTLAIIHSNQGNYAEAKRLIERALAIRERALGPDHPLVAHSLGNLANILKEYGLHEEALPLCERVVAIRERALGPDHPDVAGSLSNLANVYNDRGCYAEAQALYERALSIVERALGPDHPDVGFSLNNLGNIYVALGRYVEAEPFFERARAVRERALGSAHPSLAESLTGLGNAYVHQNRYAEAEPLFERALSLRERALGSEHAHVATTLVGLASLRKAQRRFAEALSLYERALAIKARILASDNPELTEIRADVDALRAITLSQNPKSHSDP